MAQEVKYEYNKKRRIWLEDKNGKFSASKISVLLTSTPTDLEIKKDSTIKFGKGAITYIQKIAKECVSKVNDEEYGLNVLQLENGIRYEGIAIDIFFKEFLSKHKGLSLNMFGEANPKFYLYNNYSGCSPDATFSFDGIDLGVIECKRPTNETQMNTIIELHKKTLFIQKNENILEYNVARQKAFKYWNFNYYCQVQFQMMCLKVDRSFWISYNDEMNDIRANMIIIPITPDIELQNKLKVKLIEANYLKNKIIDDYNNALNNM